MTADALLRALRERGIEVRADGGRLVVKPASELTLRDRELLAEHSAELLALLRAPKPKQKPKPDPDPMDDTMRAVIRTANRWAGYDEDGKRVVFKLRDAWGDLYFRARHELSKAEATQLRDRGALKPEDVEALTIREAL